MRIFSSIVHTHLDKDPTDKSGWLNEQTVRSHGMKELMTSKYRILVEQFKVLFVKLTLTKLRQLVKPLWFCKTQRKVIIPYWENSKEITESYFKILKKGNFQMSKKTS